MTMSRGARFCSVEDLAPPTRAAAPAIKSSIWVATITGLPARRQARTSPSGGREPARDILPELTFTRSCTDGMCRMEARRHAEPGGMMSKNQQQLARLRRYIASVQGRDPKLAEESADLAIQTEAMEAELSPEALDQAIEQESIVMRRELPVLAIKDNVTKLVFIDRADSEIWGVRLEKARPLLDYAIPSVGRIDLTGGQLSWVGTGWLVAENVVVTNRHVAREFATPKATGSRSRWVSENRCRPPSISSRRSTIPDSWFSGSSSRCPCRRARRPRDAADRNARPRAAPGDVDEAGPAEHRSSAARRRQGEPDNSPDNEHNACCRCRTPLIRGARSRVGS